MSPATFDPNRVALRREWAASAGRFFFTLTEHESDIWVMELEPKNWKRGGSGGFVSVYKVVLHYTLEVGMERPLKLKRKNVMLEQSKLKRLVRKLDARSESEAIRTLIDDALFAEEVMTSVRELRRRGTLRDAYHRADRE